MQSKNPAENIALNQEKFTSAEDLERAYPEGGMTVPIIGTNKIIYGGSSVKVVEMLTKQGYQVIRHETINEDLMMARMYAGPNQEWWQYTLCHQDVLMLGLSAINGRPVLFIDGLLKKAILNEGEEPHFQEFVQNYGVSFPFELVAKGALNTMFVRSECQLKAVVSNASALGWIRQHLTTLGIPIIDLQIPESILEKTHGGAKCRSLVVSWSDSEFITPWEI